MAETITITHSTLTSGRDVVRGDPMAPVKIHNNKAPDLNGLLHDVDRDVNRNTGGFFFDTIENVFVAGYLTPRDSSEPGVRDKEYFFNVFECDVRDVEKLDLVGLRNYFSQHAVTAPNQDFVIRKKLEYPDSNEGDPTQSPYSLETVASIWDQLRRGDGPVVAQLDEVSYFTSKVQGSLRELSYVDSDVENVTQFAIMSGESPGFDSERQGHLLEILKRINNGPQYRIKFGELPTIGQEQRIAFENELDENLESLRESLEYSDEVRDNWMDFFENEIDPLLEEHLSVFIKLHRARVDPQEDIEKYVEDKFVLTQLYDRLLSDNQPPIEAGLEKKTDIIVEEIQRAIFEQLEDRIEETVRAQTEAMLNQSNDSAQNLRQFHTQSRKDDSGKFH